MVEKTIRAKSSNAQNPVNDVNNDADVKFYVQFFNLSQFKYDRKRINQIVNTYVKLSDEQAKLDVIPFFKPAKISSQFSTRCRSERLSRSNVVYNFCCPLDECNSSYIGYTEQTLENRIKQHRYKSSSIFKHFENDHKMSVLPSVEAFKQCFSILYSSYCSNKLKIVEAFKIKTEKPIINVKYNELYDFLRLF